MQQKFRKCRLLLSWRKILIEAGMSQEPILILPILIFLTTGTNPKLLLNLENPNKNLIECLVKIVESRAETTFKLAVQNSQDYTFLTSEILKTLTTPVIINVIEHHIWQGLDERLPADVSLILDTNLNTTEILNNTLWTTDTRFLIIMKNKTNLETTFQKFWDKRVTHAYALIDNNDSISVYSFEPYKSKNCTSVNIKIIDECINGQLTRNGLTEIKNDTKIKNYNGCPVNISVVNVKPNALFHDECNCNATKHIDGIEGKLFIELTKKFNVNATYVLPSDGILWGWIHPSPAGVVGDVFTGRSELGFGLLAPTLERYESLDISIPYNGDECITFGVPRGAGVKRPDWLSLLISEFPLETWMYVLFTFISVCFAYCFLYKMSQKTSPYLIFVPFDFFALILNMPVKASSTSTLRIIFLSWVWYSFILTNHYQAAMGSTLTVKKLDPDVNTFHDLLFSKLKITGYYNLLRLMQYEHNEGEMKNMADKYITTKFDIEEAVNQIVDKREIAHLRHTTTFLYNSLINPKARGQIHVIKDCVYRYYPSFVMKKYSPILKRVNQIVVSLKEMGLVQYWRSIYVYHYPPTPEGFVKLSQEHMKGLFYVFLIGHALSLAIFLLEILYHTLTQCYGKILSTRSEGRNFKLGKKKSKNDRKPENLSLKLFE